MKSKTYVWMMVVVMVGPGCAVPTAAWKGKVEWPVEGAATNIAAGVDAGGVLAAAAAVQEMIQQNKNSRMFNQRFDRCGGPRGRVLDWWYFYAVTPQGQVVGESPPMMKEAEVMESGKAHEGREQEAGDL